jgi:ribonuclease BN (tRNA processing enzyme)
MRLTILGSGTSIPTVDRGAPGVLVRAGGRTVLVDLGPGTLSRLPRLGVDLGDVDVVLFTHFHTDHAADLAPLLFALKSPRYEGRGPLRILGAEGLRHLHAALEEAWGAWIRPTSFAWELEEIRDGSEVGLGGGLRGRTVAVDHTPASLAWRLTGPDGEVAAVSGDTRPCPGAIEAGRRADLYVLECAFPDGMDHVGHLTPTLAGEIAAEAEPRHLCLTHFYPECEGEDLESGVRASWTGPLTLARDGLTFEVRSGGAEIES